MNRFAFFLVLLVFWSTSDLLFAQSRVDAFLTPSDTLNYNRRNAVLIAEGSVAAATLVGLHELWYANYPQSEFHFNNDNSEWLQMDKMGHVFSTYYLTNYSSNAMRWAGMSSKNQLIYGASVGLAFMTTVEIFDGHSSNWGASTGDFMANLFGSGLFVGQELLWREQRIVPKFSYHSTAFASQNPELLGSSWNEKLLKDYNGQTYWLSFNLYSFFKWEKIPKWFNLAFGYGAHGLLSANPQTTFESESRHRQFYVSLDVDLTKIKTKSPLLKTFFSVFNAIKIPAPTLEFSCSRQVQWHFVYF